MRRTRLFPWPLDSLSPRCGDHLWPARWRRGLSTLHILTALQVVTGCGVVKDGVEDVKRLEALNDTSAQAIVLYDVSFCVEECRQGDSSTVLVDGLLVLSEGHVDPMSLRARMSGGVFVSPSSPLGEPPNGCFHLYRRGEWEDGAFVPTNTTGVFSWKRQAGSGLVVADLLEYPDAILRIHLAVRDSNLSGFATWLPTSTMRTSRKIVVKGHRLGVADQVRCAA